MYEPVIINRKNGGYLAVSPDDSPIRIGVAAATEDAARSDFHEAMERWELLLRSGGNGSEVDDQSA